jgi:hypothetical protein
LDENSTPFVRILVAFEEIGIVDARVSEAGVEQWTELRKGLPMVSATAVTLWNGEIFVGTQSKGVFRYVSEHARFEPFNQGLLLTTAELAQDQ